MISAGVLVHGVRSPDALPGHARSTRSHGAFMDFPPSTVVEKGAPDVISVLAVSEATSLSAHSGPGPLGLYTGRPGGALVGVRPVCLSYRHIFISSLNNPSVPRLKPGSYGNPGPLQALSEAPT